MSTTSKETQKIIQALERVKSLERFAEQVAPLGPGVYDPQGIPTEEPFSKTGQDLRLSDIRARLGKDLPNLSSSVPFAQHERLKGNIENFIGMAQVPVVIAGPLLVQGLHAQGHFHVPLATTEGALVASYSRGMKATGLSGGVSAVCLTEGVQRSPYFKFERVHEAGRFVGWLMGEIEAFERIVAATSRHARLLDLQSHIEGNSVILTFEYTTGDASGQNMVTLCTNAICKDIVARSPLKPEAWYVESNYSGDKKATALSFSTGRGRKVVCECVLLKDVVSKVLKTTPQAMADYWQASTLAVVQSGAIGAQGHVANGLAALFIACGQDAACVAESATGITRMQVIEGGDLYVALTLPNIMVGTVGGGTGLPTQRECLELLDCFGEGKAKKLAEITAATALCGEISIAAALSAGHFSDAHKVLGRK